MAGNDPWDAWTLEWSTTSPPPDYNFAIVPAVRSRRPLWDLKHPGRSGLEVRVEETAFGSTEHCAETTRDAAGPRTAWQGRHVVPDRRRVGDLQHLRGRLSLLRGQEPDRALSERGAARSGIQLDLPVRLELHHRDGRTRAAAQRNKAVRDLVAVHHRAGLHLSRGHRARVVSADLSRWADHQHATCSAQRFIRWWDCTLFT